MNYQTVAGNPDIEDKLRQEIESVSDKVDTHIVNAWNNFSGANSTGYIKLVTIKIVALYVNYPLRFTVIGRGMNKPVSLSILFDSIGDIDPGIDKYTFDASVSNPYDFKFYIVRETSSIWSIYASKPLWTTLAVISAETFCLKTNRMFEVTYPNVLVDALPEGSLEFTAE